jgi:hypothetical protein
MAVWVLVEMVVLVFLPISLVFPLCTLVAVEEQPVMPFKPWGLVAMGVEQTVQPAVMDMLVFLALRILAVGPVV